MSWPIVVRSYLYIVKRFINQFVTQRFCITAEDLWTPTFLAVARRYKCIVSMFTIFRRYTNYCWRFVPDYEPSWTSWDIPKDPKANSRFPAKMATCSGRFTLHCLMSPQRTERRTAWSTNRLARTMNHASTLGSRVLLKEGHGCCCCLLTPIAYSHSYTVI